MLREVNELQVHSSGKGWREYLILQSINQSINLEEWESVRLWEREGERNKKEKTDLSNRNAERKELVGVLASWFCGIVGNEHQLLPLIYQPIINLRSRLRIGCNLLINQNAEMEERESAFDRSMCSVSRTPSISLSPFQITPAYSLLIVIYFFVRHC